MTNIVQLLGDEAEHLLQYRCTGIARESLHLPGPDYVERVTAINPRAGGMGLISGRMTFQKPMQDGIALLNAIQDVYAAKGATVA